jgi:hypothetical protein
MTCWEVRNERADQSSLVRVARDVTHGDFQPFTVWKARIEVRFRHQKSGRNAVVTPLAFRRNL